ncbi:hypothetical protein ACHHYP_13773 [Achlya hypogyna]|uniref:Uncharacterized protein n=1 Tax=Achlya hypogyna TaxID=1202772 RepID=A0A1V9YEQ0_ACHHY|nr:hypothetical protein ACHHYP_13773 [Achlya hypogyna]
MYLIQSVITDGSGYDLDTDLAMASVISQSVHHTQVMYVEISLDDERINRVYTNWAMNNIRSVYEGSRPTHKLDLLRQMAELKCPADVDKLDKFSDEYKKLVHRLKEAGDTTPEAEQRFEYIYKLPNKWQVDINRILDGILDKEPKYYSLAKVIERMRAVAINEKHTVNNTQYQVHIN